MKYVLMLFLLMSCSRDVPSVNMKEFTEMCKDLASDLGIERYGASAFYDVDTGMIIPNCSLDIPIGNFAYRIIHFKKKDLESIEFYKRNKK